MSSIQTILKKMRDSPQNIRFEDLLINLWGKTMIHYKHYTYRVTWSQEDN